MSGPSSTTAVVAAPPNREDSAEACRYRVFLSYSHADAKWARWLMRKLEGYHVSSRFHGRRAPIGEVGPRIAPVFRDRDELPTTSDLGETIRTALRESATLVVICSPASAKSSWVQNEIVEFKRLGGRDRVFAFIVDGEPKNAGTADDCFSPGLRNELGPDGRLSDAPAEVVAADARPHADGRSLAFVRLVAGLLGVGFDELRRRELQRRNRRLTLIAIGSTLGMALTLALAAAAWVARNDAERRQEQGEELLAFMLGDMKTRLQKADKLDALEDVGAKMLTYFQSLKPRDLTDNTLTQQAKALNQIGQIRIAQLRYRDATAAFSAAFERSAALVERHSRDGEMRFERAQAEYWIGNVYYKQGDHAKAREWMTQYRNTSVTLVGLDPANLRWQREAVSAHHNLAVLELERGQLQAARSGFAGELAVLEKMSAANPDDRDLQLSISNTISFLGTVAERSGDYPEAVARFGEQVRRLEVRVKAEPRTPRWRYRLGHALALQATVMALSGQRSAALERRRLSGEIFEELSAQDPTNREWRIALLNARFRDAVLLRAMGDVPAATRLAREGRPQIEDLAKTESSDRGVTALLAATWLLEAQLLDDAREAGAAEAAAQAIAIGKKLLEQNRANENNRGDYASACVVAGLIAQKAGNSEVARQHWQTAVALIDTSGRAISNWRLLDPVVRAHANLGQSDECRALLAPLRRSGYQPLDPWPEAIRALLSASNESPNQRK